MVAFANVSLCNVVDCYDTRLYQWVCNKLLRAILHFLFTYIGGFNLGSQTQRVVNHFWRYCE